MTQLKLRRRISDAHEIDLISNHKFPVMLDSARYRNWRGICEQIHAVLLGWA